MPELPPVMGCSMSGLVARMRRHFRNRSRGQSFVEFALVLPIFLVFLAATLDLGRVFYANITLNNAAREGAFQAAKTPEQYVAGQPCDQATNRIVCRVQNESVGSMVAIQPDDIDVKCDPVSCPESAGATVTVEVGGEFRLITPILSFVFGGQDLHLTSSAVAQIEYLPNLALITPPPGPVAQFTGSPRNIEPGQSVTFDSSLSTGDPTGFQWDFDGDAMVDSTDPNPTFTYTTAGTFTVTLTVVNLTGVDIEQKSSYVTVTAPPTATSTSTATAAATPACVYPPNLIGKSKSNAEIALQDAGFSIWTWTYVTTGPKGKVQGQNPDHTECLALTEPFQLVYRNP
jgi:PKD repeat protein